MTLVHTSCPACLGASAASWGVNKGAPILKCQACSTLFFARPVVEVNDYSGYYEYLVDFDRMRVAAELNIRRKQARAKLNVIEGMMGSRALSMLDVGSGPGYFGALAREAGHNVICGEVNRDAIQYGQTQFGVEFVDIFEPDIGPFDVVTFFHVIEHLEEPDNLVARGLNLLKPGGLCYCHVPLGESAANQLETALKRTLGRAPERRGSLYLPDHLTGFSKAGLESFAMRHGLSSIRVGTVHMFQNEYDPLFIPFRGKDLKAVGLLGADLARGAIDWAFGGSWLRLTAHKPMQ
jgi:SAM-dependent methyltransferase